MTAVKAFLSFFWISFIFFDLGASMFVLLEASIELVRVHASAHGAHKRTTALLDRETRAGPRADLTWQCAVDSGSRRVRRARGRL